MSESERRSPEVAAMIRAITYRVRARLEWLIRLVKASVLIFALVGMTQAQLSRMDGIVLGPRGNPIAGATIAICSPGANVNLTPCSPLATLFSYSIVAGTGAVRAGGTTTITTTIAHGLSIGQTVIISGVVDTSFSGSFVVPVPSNTTFQYLQTGLPNATSGSGSVGSQNPITSDALGNYFWFATPGKYIVQMSGPQLAQTVVQQGITVPCDPTVTSCNALSTLFPETAAPAGAAGFDVVWGDSTAQRLKFNNNNAGADSIVGAATTDTLTNKTLDTAGAGNVLKINGTQVSATTGSGSVVLNNAPTFTGDLSGQRFNADQGSALVSGDFSISGGWGGSAIKSGIAGTDQAGTITVQANGTTSGNPQVT